LLVHGIAVALAFHKEPPPVDTSDIPTATIEATLISRLLMNQRRRRKIFQFRKRRHRRKSNPIPRRTNAATHKRISKKLNPLRLPGGGPPKRQG